MNTAQQLKADGQQKVLAFDPIWTEQAMAFLRQFAVMRGAEPFLIEDMRFLAAWLGLPLPHTHKAWGALATAACKAGIIVPTGEYRATRSARTHGHPARVWRSA